jgi:NAD(P)-dependent dehydrogenase (short-subunit alcohol dehydrogenase family)
MTSSEKVAVITGASSGIGRATALEFARKGYSVVLGARRENALKALEQECIRLGGKALAFPLDVTYESDVYRMAEAAIHHFGRIDIWINNAAVSALGCFENMPMEDIRRVIDINLFGYIHGAKAVVPHFKARKEGILINISSLSSKTGLPYAMPFSVSKFAIRGLSLALQQELSEFKNIHVCTVLPGIIDTPLFQHAANYMGSEVKAPGLATDAEDVALVLADLVVNPKAEITIGKISKMPFLLIKRLNLKGFNKKFRKMTYNHLFTKEPNFPTRGNLYDPMNEYASISGGWMHESQPVNKKRIAVASILTAGAIGAGLLTRGAVKRGNKKSKKQKQEKNK